jgi:hypothetical protein
LPAGACPWRGDVIGDRTGRADRSTGNGVSGIGSADDGIGSVAMRMHHVMGMLGRLRARDRKQCRARESRSYDSNFLGIHFLFSMGFFMGFFPPPNPGAVVVPLGLRENVTSRFSFRT